MSQQTYRGNLSQPNYPFLASKQGRTVIIDGIDQAYVVGMNAEGQYDKQKIVPAAYYMENVLPYNEGYKAIAYRQMCPASPARILQAIPVPDPDGNIGFIGFGSDNRYWFAIKAAAGAYVWINGGPFDPALNGQISYLTNISSAYINGTFYFYIPNIGCYRYDTTINQVVPQTLTGLDPVAVRGISSAFGYLIAYTKDAIAWSSLTDPTDFVPSLITGAGGGNVQEARGVINFIYPIYQGFVIYTSGNVVASSYTGNVRFPFNLRELVGSSGVSDSRLLAIAETGDSHYVYTTSGLQSVTLRGAQVMEPAFTDFISGGIIEEFNSETGVFSTRSAAAPLEKKLALCGNRFLVMSYGMPSASTPVYEYAIVFDLVLKRYGKLKINHYDMMYYFFLNNTDKETFENSQLAIAFQTPNGQMLAVDTRENAVGKSGLILLGKFQSDRNHLVQLVRIDIENASPDIEVSDLYSIDGKNTIREAIPHTAISSGGLVQKLTRVTGLNHSILIEGDFSLTSFLITFWVHGRR